MALSSTSQSTGLPLLSTLYEPPPKHLISVLGGALLLGNNPYTGEALAKLQDGAKGWYDNQRMGENITGSSTAEVDREALQLALAFVQQHPDLFIRYAIQKFRHLSNSS